MESAQKVIKIYSNVEQITYDVSLRNPKGVKILVSLPTYVVGKAFEALADVERVQVFNAFF